MDLPSPPNSSSASDAQNSPDSATMGLPGYSHSVDGSFSSDSSDAGVGLDVGAAMAMDWSTMFWPPATFDSVVSDPTHVQDMHMEIDPQLLGVDPAAIFGQPTEPSQSLQLATPHELAGLAPLLDAFPFDFDLTRYPVKQSQEPHAVHNFSPSPSPESQTVEDDIARIARETAGIMHAVIATGSGLELSLPQYIVTSRQQPGSASSSSSSTGSPPPATPLDTPQAAFAQVAVQQDAAHADAAHADASLAPKARPKTSHTTIERRYRTNLNARIVALRAAVPATAHLDTPGSVTLDTRGRADGVTPARKGSKATILAKAVEYITVLKAREIRLRRDTDGLRNLVRGLVGGDQLLNAWEASWKQRWGTMEDDEARLAGDAVGGSDDEDSDDEDSRPAKKQKKSPTLAAPTAASVSPASAAPSRKNVPGIDPITGEKRKRGRPRKVPLPAATAPVQPVAVAPAPQVIMQQPQPQYLLAVFALFSLWSNAPSTQSTNSGSGSVVADAVQPLVNTAGLNFTWMQAVHLMASVAVLASIIIPLARRQFTSRKVQKPEVSASIVNTAEVESDNESEDLASVHSNSSSAGPGTPLTSETEIELTVATGLKTVAGQESKAFVSAQLAHALGATGAVGSVLGAGAKYAMSTVRVGRRTMPKTDAEKVEGWARLADALVLEGAEAPFATKLQTYLTLSAARPHSATHLASLALLAHSLGLPDAPRAWESIHSDSPADMAVLSRQSVEDATDDFLALPPTDESECALRRLAREWVKAEARAVARDAFMCVARGLPGDPERADELRAVGEELGGREARIAGLVAACTRVQAQADDASPVGTVSMPVLADDAELGDAQTEDIIRAIALFCQRERNSKDTLALLQLLGRPTFDVPALDDARDRMVDDVRAKRRL